MFPDAATDRSAIAQQLINNISSFAMWVQAWNIYTVSFSNPQPQPNKMISYQSLICFANALLPLQSWLKYDAKFHTLAAADPFLHWEQSNSDALTNKEQ